MALIETSTTINASAEKIFSYISSLDSMKNEYVVSVEADGPIKLGTKIKTTTKAMNGMQNTITSEVIAYEKDKIYGTKTYAAPPASDVVSTYILEPAGTATKVIMQTEAVLTPPGMPSMPGMEDMMKKQMVAGFDASLAALKKKLEG
ncbi:MAG: Polyketide cyclase / dehydrase and lipid transport [Chloroflexi bacterium OLB14]|nr:MAG: Polyketide cyclase / dehydrase and lipid transport [Chloroflexi bacterium OLB14]